MIVSQRHWIIATAAALIFLLVLTLLKAEHGQKLSDASRQWLSTPQEKPWSTVDTRLFAKLNEYNKSDLVPAGTHQVISSHTSSDGKYMFIDYRGLKSFNPNIIPHPTLDDTWMVVAQKWKEPDDHSIWFTELVCNARFENNVLICIDYPSIVPIAATTTTGCDGDYAYFSFNIGPHDARVFMGPDQPFIVYGSQSPQTCFGLWAQDFRMVSDWRSLPDPNGYFQYATSLQRPKPYRKMEKNWFMFWDSHNNLYAHYDVKPYRSFAQLHPDGSTGGNLAPTTKDHDNQCLVRHLAGSEVSVHQATNSLRITMCHRTDPTCTANASNTFIMSIIHHQTVARFHGMYEPYVMLLDQDAPFKVHAYGQRPLWIKGRGMSGQPSSFRFIPEDHSEQFYVTSINWKERGLNYHGYLDDIILMGVGLEDSMSAVIDVRAEDLVTELLIC